VIVGALAIVVPPFTSALLSVFPAGTVAGLPALILNIVVTVLVSLATRPPNRDAVAVGMPAAAPVREAASVGEAG
jgi:SSS family solute:Na+ symporter